MKVVIVGTGDLAHGLAQLFKINFKKEIDSYYEIVATEPIENVDTPEFLQDSVPIIEFEEALTTGDMLLLAIPARALKQFIHDHFEQMKSGVILVDCTNSRVKDEDLVGALVALDIDFPRWVKAFNDIGAVVMLQEKALMKHKLETQICGHDQDALSQVEALAKEFGLSVKRVPEDQFDSIRGAQDSVGEEWIHAIVVMGVTFIFVLLYEVFQFRERPYFQYYQIPTRAFGKMFGWVAIWGFAYAQIPGAVAKIVRRLRGSSVELNRALLWGLGIRKHVGLIAHYFLFLHGCLELLIYNEKYFGFVEMDWNTEWSFFMAVLSTSFYIIVGIASLPSVNTNMNKAQAFLIFGVVIWMALIAGLLHVMFWGVHSWTEDPRSKHAWANDMPPVTLMASVVPLFALFLEFIYLLLFLGSILFRFLAPKTTTSPQISAAQEVDSAVLEESAPSFSA